MSSALRVSIARHTDRDRLSSDDMLTGAIEATVSALSYIHISSREELEYNEAIVRRLMREGIERVLKDLNRYRGELEGAFSLRIAAVKYGGRLCIPGSTVKGLLRARLEYLAEPYDGSIDSCFRVVGGRSKAASHRHEKIWGYRLTGTRVVAGGESCDPNQTNGAVCSVCNIFGAPGLVSRIYVGNFCAGEGSPAERVIEVLELPYGERLEAVRPGTSFGGRIIFRGVTPEELGLLFIAMGYDSTGRIMPVLIGRHKYMYSEMGKALFSVQAVTLRVYSAQQGKFGGLDISPRFQGFEAILDQKSTNEFIKHCIQRALSRYRFATLSEAEIKDRLNVASSMRTR